MPARRTARSTFFKIFEQPSVVKGFHKYLERMRGLRRTQVLNIRLFKVGSVETSLDATYESGTQFAAAVPSKAYRCGKSRLAQACYTQRRFLVPGFPLLAGIAGQAGSCPKRLGTPGVNEILERCVERYFNQPMTMQN